MKKEAIIAMIFGIFLGGIFAVVIILKNKQIQQEKSKTITVNEKSDLPQKLASVNLQSLEILEPKDNIIVYKNEIIISGKGPKDFLLIVQSPIKDLVFEIKKDQFSINYPLTLGENVIRIVLYPKDKKMRIQEKELRIYYLKDQI